MISKTKTLEKASNILKCFTPSEPSWTGTALSRRLGIPVTTLHGILADLVALDFLSQSPSKEYKVGLRYMEMGFLHANNFELNNIAHGVMQKLSLAVQEMVGLSLMYQGWMYVSTSVLPVPTVRDLKYLGPRLPAHVSAGGMAVLAHLPPEDVEAYRRIDWARTLPAPPAVPESWDLEESLARVRERGYSVGLIASENGNPRTLGAPIFGRERQVIAGLVVIGSHEGFTDGEMARIGTQVIAAAGEISLRSGHLVRNANCV